MAHGIFSTKEENGRYPRQAALHHAADWRTIRFDWQGHGEHPVSFADSTVGGNLDDLESVSTFVNGTFGGPLRIVASSFGASIPLLREISARPSFERNVLLNPVTDYKHTFDGPATGQLEAAFARNRWEEAMSQGSVVLAPGKVLSRRMAFELKTLEPFRAFQTLRLIHKP